MTDHLDFIEIFPWTPQLETGIESIDQQHKKLVDLLNLLTLHLVNHDEVKIAEVFDELASYANYHFESEELVWEPYFKDDEWYIKHKSTHSSFLPAVLDIKESHSNKNLSETVQIIVTFLIRWLAQHIIGEDKKMALLIHKVESGLSFDTAKQETENEFEGSSLVLIETALTMYDRLSSRTLDLMRERNERKKVEFHLIEANKRLEALSITDQLTDLYNRRYFDHVFDRELRRAKRAKHFFTFIMLDIDHFKSLNDTYGHLDGDKALKKVSKLLKEFCQRSGDYVFRLGGEEFGILITDQNEPLANDYIDNLRLSIEKMKIPNKHTETKYLTASMGIITKIPELTDTEDYFLSTADSLLYQAKMQGRNCFKVFSNDRHS